MDVTASVSDDVHVDAAQLLAYLDGGWSFLGPKVTPPLSPGVFDWDVNLCQAGAFNGPLQIGLAVWDHEGNFRAPLSVGMFFPTRTNGNRTNGKLSLGTNTYIIVLLKGN